MFFQYCGRDHDYIFYRFHGHVHDGEAFLHDERDHDCIFHHFHDCDVSQQAVVFMRDQNYHEHDFMYYRFQSLDKQNSYCIILNLYYALNNDILLLSLKINKDSI